MPFTGIEIESSLFILKEAEKLKRAIELNQLHLAERLAHTVKEISSKLEYIKIKSYAFKVEMAIRKGDVETAIGYTSKIMEEIVKI